jgi:hypothetical protein
MTFFEQQFKLVPSACYRKLFNLYQQLLEYQKPEVFQVNPCSAKELKTNLLIFDAKQNDLTTSRWFFKKK